MQGTFLLHFICLSMKWEERYVRSFSSPTFCDILHMIFTQIKGNQMLVFIWQVFLDGVSEKGPVLVGENGHVKKL